MVIWALHVLHTKSIVLVYFSFNFLSTSSACALCYSIRENPNHNRVRKDFGKDVAEFNPVQHWLSIVPFSPKQSHTTVCPLFTLLALVCVFLWFLWFMQSEHMWRKVPDSKAQHPIALSEQFN